MKKYKIITMLILFVATASAQKGKKIRGNGNVVTLERITSDYDAISVSAFFDVEIVKGEEGKLILKGEDNILEHIETVVENETLIIRKKKHSNLRPALSKGVFITIPVQKIKAITSSGSGKVISTMTLKADVFKVRSSGSRKVTLNIETESMSAKLSGSSSIQLSGISTVLSAKLSGSSNLNCYKLEVDDASINSSGSSKTRILVNSSMNARVSGSGHIWYRGNPKKMESKTSGSAKISKGV